MLPTFESYIYTASNKIYMMDTTNITHVTISEFSIKNQSPPEDNPGSNYKDKKIFSSPQIGAIIFGSVVAGLIGGSFLGIGLEFFREWLVTNFDWGWLKYIT